MQTLRIAKVVQRKLNLQNEFLEPSTCELQALGEMPVLAAMQEVEEMKSMKPEFLEVEASCQIFTMELDSSRVWKDSLNVRLFCFFHAELRRFRLVSDNHVNAQVYKGMVLVTKGRFLQWRDAKLAYLVKFASKEDCGTVADFLVSIGAVRVWPSVLDGLLEQLEEMRAKDIPEGSGDDDKQESLTEINVVDDSDALDDCISAIESLMLEDVDKISTDEVETTEGKSLANEEKAEELLVLAITDEIPEANAQTENTDLILPALTVFEQESQMDSQVDKPAPIYDARDHDVGLLKPSHPLLAESIRGNKNRSDTIEVVEVIGPPRASFRAFASAVEEEKPVSVKDRSETVVEVIGPPRASFRAFAAAADATDSEVRTEALIQVPVKAPPLPPKVVRVPDRRRSVELLPAPPPPPKKNDEQVKKAINSALASWLDGSESTLRRVITLSTQASAAPKSTAMLRSMARIDANNIEPFATSGGRIVADISSDESSEFVDIDGDGIRFEGQMRALKEEETVESSDLDESEERRAIEHLKIFSKKQ